MTAHGKGSKRTDCGDGILMGMEQVIGPNLEADDEWSRI
jgi:hypothetical protein